jgi:hypothetical protein
MVGYARPTRRRRLITSSLPGSLRSWFIRCCPASQAGGDHDWHRKDTPGSLEVSTSDTKVTGLLELGS